MSMTGTNPEYCAALVKAWEDELSGVPFFSAMLPAARSAEEREKLLLLSELEALMAARLEPVLARHGLWPRDTDGLVEAGRVEGETWARDPWPQLMRRFVDDFVPYLTEFRALESSGPVEDRATLALLMDHEIAIVCFAVAELRGEPDSVAILRDFLARVHAETGATAASGPADGCG